MHKNGPNPQAKFLTCGKDRFCTFSVAPDGCKMRVGSIYTTIHFILHRLSQPAVLRTRSRNNYNGRFLASPGAPRSYSGGGVQKIKDSISIPAFCPTRIKLMFHGKSLRRTPIREVALGKRGRRISVYGLRGQTQTFDSRIGQARHLPCGQF